MDCLIDTSILVRLSGLADPDRPLAFNAIATLRRGGHQLVITPQNLVELWNVATRPAAVNGLGLPLSEATKLIAAFEDEFSFAEETPQLFPTLKALAIQAGVTGKQIHDARLVAICHLHAISSILTFNGKHFARFAAIGPGLKIVEPAAVLNP
jgi:predicted nucleic acid-binding protein